VYRESPRAPSSWFRVPEACALEDDDRDHPLSCHWRPVAPDTFDLFGLPPLRSRAAVLGRAQIITEAFVVGRADPDGWISYSRRYEFYAARRSRYWPTTYTYDTILPAVDQLAAAGLLDHEKMPSGNRGRQSRFRASPELHKRLSNAPLAVLHDPHELVILRDHEGNLVDYSDTERSRRWRRNIEEINEGIMSAAIELRTGLIRNGDPLQVGKSKIGAASNKLYRVFNRGKFSLGGRFYGAWWQNVPAEIRATIKINGADTVELDYPRLHPTLLYSLAGKPMDGDPYDLAGWPRDLVKVGFNTLVNADTPLSAQRSIANEIGGEGAHAKAQALVRDIEAKHPAIAHMFASGAGLALMRRDSEMTEALLLQLTARGVVALPIHDSYVVAEQSKGDLMESMAEALQKSIGNNVAISKDYPKSLPQYGGPCPGTLPAGFASLGAPVGFVCVFFPEQRQRDFFGGHSLAVPAEAVLGWSGGIAPPEVCKALRHEMRRRNQRHRDVAARVGVSRPQFENILQGRFGASPKVAGRIRGFLIEGASTVGTAA
jgi:hypothetical protein